MSKTTKKDPSFSEEDIEYYTQKVYTKNAKLKNLIDVIECFIYAMVAVLLIFTLFARLTVVDGPSMNNTLKHGEYLIVANVLFTYEPQNGDIVVVHGDFKNYYDSIYAGKKHNIHGEYYSDPIVKRVIATEGQTIKIDYAKKEIFVNGKKLDESYAIYEVYREDVFTLGRFVKDENGNEYYKSYYDMTTKIFEATVPENCVFVMGDNRDNSADSRLKEIGFVPEEFIVGKAVFRLTPFNRMGGL